MSTRLKAALELAALGIPVLPLHTPTAAGRCSCGDVQCRSPGKHPRTANGVKNASTDSARIARWWKKFPDANIGGATGGGLRVLDVDPRHGGNATLAQLEAEHGPLPKTVTVETGGRGQHLYFRVPKGATNSCGKAGPGLDIKGEGGYVVAPPSLHASGASYRWIRDLTESEIAPLPEWLETPIGDHVNGGAEPSRGRPKFNIYVPGEIEALIRNGGDERYESRSEAEWRVLCTLLEMGTGTSVIKALMKNPQHRMSERILEKGEKWFDSEIARARGYLKVLPEQFYAFMPQHTYYHVPSMQWWPPASVDGRLKRIQIGENDKGKPVFLPASRWLDRNRPVELMCWMPGEPMIVKDRYPNRGGWIEKVGIRCLNIYRPSNVKLGDAGQAGPWVDLLKKVYPSDYEHLIRYFAHRVQKPGEKINHALVMGGKPRIGKDTILEPVKRAVGPWNFADVSVRELKGNNNEFAMSVVLRINETRDLGEVSKYELYEHMKQYEAAPPDVIRINEKHLRQYYAVNVCGVIYTTNHKTDGMYFPADDERHYVAWSELGKEDFSDGSWKELWAWYENGGFGQVAAYLHTYDLADFNPKAPPPKTAAFWEMIAAHRAPESNELASLLDFLGHPDAVTRDILIDSAYRAGMHSFEHWLADRKSLKLLPHRLEDVGYTAVMNPGNKDGQWKIGGRNRMVYAKAELPETKRLEGARKVPVVAERELKARGN